MIWETIEVAAALIESFIIVHFLSRFLGYKNDNLNFLKFLSGFVMVFTDSLFIPAFIKSDVIAGTIMIIICFIYCAVFLKGNIYIKVFAVILCNILILIINSLVLTGFSSFYSSDFETLIASRDIVRFEILVSTKFLYLLFTQLILAVCHKKDYELNTTEWLAIVTIFITTIVGAIAVFQLLLDVENTDLSAAVILTGLVLIDITAYFFMVKNSKNNRVKKRADLLELQLSEQCERISDINQMYEEVLQIRHDMKKCISCASALIKKGNYTEAEKYLENIAEEKIGPIKDYVILNNSIASAVINSRLSQCSNEGIRTTVSISDCINDFPEIDISVLLANILDNAIEACRKCQENKYIDFNVKRNKGYIKILVKNSMAESETNRKEFKSTKTDIKNHGFGIKTVKEIAEKYDGMADFHREQGFFIADIWLKDDVSQL